MAKETEPQPDVVAEANRVVEKRVFSHIRRYKQCGCHQCRLQARSLVDGWLRRYLIEVNEEEWQLILYGL